MTNLLEKALRKVQSLSSAEQDAIAAQIMDSLADEAAWKEQFARNPELVRRLAQEALEGDERGETRPLDEIL